jgi:SAM-dependent methyltransferase
MTPAHPWLAATLDLVMRPLYPARRLVVPDAVGSVLEVGAGTGLNFELYDWTRVRLVTGIEPDPHMLRRARERAAALGRPIRLVASGGEALPFRDASFDTVVITWVLCTIPDPAAALAEVRRVLRRGGAVLFAEHTRSVQPALARVQAALNPVWTRFSGGCRLDRPGVDLLRRAGLQVERVEPFGRERWTLVPTYRGVARPETPRR